MVKKIFKIIGWFVLGLFGLILVVGLYLYIDFPRPFGLDKKHEKPIAIQNVTVIDTENGVAIPNQTVLLKDSLISQVTDSDKANLPDEVEIIDGTDKYLSPGFWNMHTHVGLSLSSAIDYGAYLANGITGLRDMAHYQIPIAASLSDHQKWNQEVRSGTLAGPRIISSASHIIDGVASRVDGMPDFIGPETAEQGRQVANFIKEEGYDFIKPYNRVNRQAYFAMMDEAQKIGLKAGGHRPKAVSAIEAAQAGQRSIEHARVFLQESNPRSAEFRAINYNTQDKKYMVDSFNIQQFSEICSVLVAHDTYICPTHTTRAFDVGLYNDEFLNDPLLKYIPSVLKEGWRLDAKEEREEAGEGEAKQILYDFYKKGVELTGLAHQRGVKIMVGTDAPDSYCFPGFSYHRELEHFKEAGLNEAEILRAATLTAAEYENKQDKYGTVSVGKYADLILFDKNPLAAIENTKSITTVIMHGYVYNHSELQTILDEAEANASSAILELAAFVLKVAGGGDDLLPHHNCSGEQCLVDAPYKTAILKMRTRAYSRLRASPPSLKN